MNAADFLEVAKDKLRITWDEEDSKVKELIEAACAEIKKRTGYAGDFNEAGIARTLMLEHVFYNWNNALNEFLRAYAPELQDLAISVAAKEAAGDGT